MLPLFLPLLSWAPVARALGFEEIQEFCANLDNNTLVIGMVTKGNTELTLSRWSMTFETYLSSELAQYGCRTKLIPLEFDTYESHTKNATIDFIFPNPTAFQEMQTLYGVHEFLSVRRNFGANVSLDRFGGVIVRSAHRYTEIELISDLAQKSLTICAVNSAAFGGWQIQWFEMLKNGVDVMAEHSVEFVGGHEAAVRAAVVDFTCDISVARTETVERMTEAGEFDGADVFVIGDQGDVLGFPLHISTELYPEWPLASLSHIPTVIEQIVAVPLLSLERDSPEAIQGDYAGFSFPYSYEPVRQMLVAIDADGTGRCDPGQYREGTNPGFCHECLAGTFSDDGIGQCRPCPIGTVNNGTGNVDCSFCSDGLTTVSVGSVAGDCAVEELDEAPIFLVILIASVIVGCVLCGLCLFVVYKLVLEYRQWRQTTQEMKAQRLKRIKHAVGAMQKLRFPLVLMQFSVLKEQGQLVTHEIARDRGDLIVLDTWRQAVYFAMHHPIVFISHQWLCFSHPDPDHLHYNSIVAACEALCAEDNHSDDDLHIWVDLQSIPQMCVDMKLCAIASIAVYACCARYFVVVAPQTTHRDTFQPCNAESYARRGWCRLEQWAFMGICGVQHMYLFESAKKTQLLNLQDVEGWLENSTYVFGGDFTVESDKHTLVDVTLGLYGFMLMNEKDVGEDSPTHRESDSDQPDQTYHLREMVPAHRKSIIFPELYFKGLDRLLEEEVRFALKHPDGASQCFNREDLDNFFSAASFFQQIQGRHGKQRQGDQVALLDGSAPDLIRIADASFGKRRTVTGKASARELGTDDDVCTESI